MKRLGCVLVLLALANPVLAAAAAPPDLSGFWNLVSRIIDPDPELAKHVPKDAVVLRDVGAAEFGPMEFGGLKPTPAALAQAKAWNPRAGLTVGTACLIPSIVYALQGPFPMEIYQGTDLMVMRLEYMDMARVFVMGNKPDWPADAPHTKVGYSRAHWEGDQLVVVTTHLKAATITNNGLDHSDKMVVTERYRLADGGKTLIASQLYEDPEALENRGVRYISWRRGTNGDHVHAYDCDPSFAEEYAKP
jgi:hypothetical protein